MYKFRLFCYIALHILLVYIFTHTHTHTRARARARTHIYTLHTEILYIFGNIRYI